LECAGGICQVGQMVVDNARLNTGRGFFAPEFFNGTKFMHGIVTFLFAGVLIVQDKWYKEKPRHQMVELSRKR